MTGSKSSDTDNRLIQDGTSWQGRVDREGGMVCMMGGGGVKRSDDPTRVTTAATIDCIVLY